MKFIKKIIPAIILVPLVLIFLFLVSFTIYSFAHTSRALHTLEEYQAAYPDLTISQDSDGSVSIIPANANQPADQQTGFIFYPGASVEPKAYIPLLAGLSQSGYPVYIPQFPFGMAFMDKDAADRIIDQHPEMKSWFIGGHSLGGRFSSTYASSHEKKVRGVISVSARIDDELADTDLPLLMLFGDRDGIFHGIKDKYRLPEDTSICCVPGANHAQFGDYGRQFMDKDATISPEEQRKAGTEAILKWLQDYSSSSAVSVSGTRSKTKSRIP